MTEIVDACPHCASRCSDDPEYAVLRLTLKWRWCEACASLVEYVRLPEPMRAARQARLYVAAKMAASERKVNVHDDI